MYQTSKRPMLRPLALALMLTAFLAGCGLPRNVVVLLPDDDGHVGRVDVGSAGGTAELAQANAAVGLHDGSAPGKVFVADEGDVKSAFSEVLAAMPRRTVSFILYFGLGSDTIDAGSKPTLDQAIARAKAEPNIDVSVIGHSDSVGDPAGNQALSLRRAKAVRDALIAAGIDGKLIEMTYHGANNPQVPAKPGVPEPRNRRVEITVR
jgi:outer membrane protein OmpA-like peptidoglycan-associated protein